jgi:alpha-1,2-mannosyltransferase
MGALMPALADWASLAPMTKLSIFYGVRWFLGMIGAACNTYLHRVVEKKYGMETAQILQLFLVISPGMFISSTAFLPSTLAMFCYTVMVAAWMTGHLIIAFHLVAFAAIMAWPFSILVGFPFAIYVLRKRGIFFALGHGIISLVIFLLPLVVVDSIFYGKLVIAPLNIVLYNVFGHAGPELYGVEPWYYYLRNGFLNFNFVFLLALLSPFILLLWGWKSGKWAPVRESLWFIAGAGIWLVYMSSVPHKEERFLFVIYPWICLAAALAVSAITHLINFPRFIGIIIALGLLVVVATSTARIGALYINYEAPNAIYTQLHNLESENRPYQVDLFSPSPSIPDSEQKLVCVGKEWYRFSTHFFLPPHLRLGFVADGFDGQLPQYYGEGIDAFSRIPPHFNDLNQEEPSRYVPISSCDYWVNFFEGAAELDAFNHANSSTWEIAFHAPFLNSARSPNMIARAFYIPTYSEEHNIYGHYCLLRKKSS